MPRTRGVSVSRSRSRLKLSTAIQPATNTRGHGQYGTNELYKYRAQAVFHHIDALHRVAYDVARSLLQQQGSHSADVEHYLSELHEFSLMRKCDILETERPQRETFHFDFARLLEGKFAIDPLEVSRPEGIEVEDIIGDVLDRTPTKGSR